MSPGAGDGRRAQRAPRAADPAWSAGLAWTGRAWLRGAPTAEPTLRAAGASTARRASPPTRRRARITLGAWIAATALLGVLGLGVEERLKPSTLVVPGSESARGAEIVERHFGETTPVSILLRGPADALDRQGQRLIAALERDPEGVRTLSPWSEGLDLDELRPHPGAALVFAELAVREGDDAADVVARIDAATEAAIAEPVSALRLNLTIAQRRADTRSAST